MFDVAFIRARPTFAGEKRVLSIEDRSVRDGATLAKLLEVTGAEVPELGKYTIHSHNTGNGSYTSVQNHSSSRYFLKITIIRI